MIVPGRKLGIGVGAVLEPVSSLSGWSGDAGSERCGRLMRRGGPLGGCSVRRCR